jgi:hypothetical protein
MTSSLFTRPLLGAIALASLPAFAGKVSIYNDVAVTDLPGLTVTPYGVPYAQSHFYTSWQNDRLETTSQEEALNHQTQHDEANVIRKRNQTALRASAQAEQIHALEQKDSIFMIAIPMEGTLEVANRLCISLTGKSCSELTNKG